jgi:hypothetical protein
VVFRLTVPRRRRSDALHLFAQGLLGFEPEIDVTPAGPAGALPELLGAGRDLLRIDRDEVLVLFTEGAPEVQQRPGGDAEEQHVVDYQ